MGRLSLSRRVHTCPITYNAPLGLPARVGYILSLMKAVKCPTCEALGDWFSGAYGPFCSRRCKLVDLGKWFSEENLISEPLRPDNLVDTDDVSPAKRGDQNEPEQ